MQKFTGSSIETAFKTISKTISCRPSKLMKKKSKNIPFAFLSFSPQNRQFRKIKETFVVVSILFEIDSPPPPSITRFYPTVCSTSRCHAQRTHDFHETRGVRVFLVCLNGDTEPTSSSVAEFSALKVTAVTVQLSSTPQET